jgi:hypothetical protein
MGKKIEITDAKYSNIKITGGNEMEGLQSGQDILLTSPKDYTIILNKIDNLTADIVAGNRIKYTNQDLKSTVQDVENIIKETIDLKPLPELETTLDSLSNENKKRAPDFKKIIDWITSIARLLSMTNLDETVLEKIKVLLSALQERATQFIK